MSVTSAIVPGTMTMMGTVLCAATIGIDPVSRGRLHLNAGGFAAGAICTHAFAPTLEDVADMAKLFGSFLDGAYFTRLREYVERGGDSTVTARIIMAGAMNGHLSAIQPIEVRNVFKGLWPMTPDFEQMDHRGALIPRYASFAEVAGALYMCAGLPDIRKFLDALVKIAGGVTWRPGSPAKAYELASSDGGRCYSLTALFDSSRMTAGVRRRADGLLVPEMKCRPAVFEPDDGGSEEVTAATDIGELRQMVMRGLAETSARRDAGPNTKRVLAKLRMRLSEAQDRDTVEKIRLAVVHFQSDPADGKIPEKIKRLAAGSQGQPSAPLRQTVAHHRAVPGAPQTSARAARGRFESSEGAIDKAMDALECPPDRRDDVRARAIELAKGNEFAASMARAVAKAMRDLGIEIPSGRPG